MPENFREVDGLRVEVERVVYMPDLDAPPERPHPFVYFIRIINESEETISIRGRKWILKDQSGQTFVVEGQGVVGENPVLETGQHFSYHSYHVIAEDSVASGAFFGRDSNSGGVLVRIPEFQLVIPTSEPD